MDNDELMAVVDLMLGRGAPVQFDDLGFSKIDHPFMSDVADRYAQFHRLSFRQRRAIARGLRKYQRQLKELGVDYDAIVEVAIETEEQAAAGGAYIPPAIPDTTFKRVGDTVVVDFGAYKPEELQKIKQVPGRRYNNEDKTWSFPVDSLPDAAKHFPGLTKMHLDMVNKRQRKLHGLNAKEQAVAKMIGEKYPHLYSFQRDGVAFLMARKEAILGDDMGLGKTKQAIIAAREVANGPFLIICPATLKGNWGLEIRDEEPGADVHIVDGNEKPLAVRNPKTGRVETFRRGSFSANGRGRWIVVNYDILSKHREELLKVKWAVAMLDEAHYIKNNSGRAQQVLGRRAQPRKQLEAITGLLTSFSRVYLLTGTPIMNRPVDLFNLLKAVRHDLSKSFMRFAYRYCAAWSNGWGLDTSGASNLEELAENIADKFLQRKKEDELDLPEKTRQFMASDFDREEYGYLEGLFMEGLSIGELSHLRQQLAISKVASTIEQVEAILETGHKAIVFSNFTEPLHQAMHHFGPAAVLVDGSVSQVNRNSAVDAFQNDPNVTVFVGQVKAAGVGLNLTAATYVVFNDYDWVPANHHQAEDRAYRIGQHNAVTVTYMHADETLDDDLRDVLLGKAEIIGAIEKWSAEKVRQRREAA